MDGSYQAYLKRLKDKKRAQQIQRSFDIEVHGDGSSQPLRQINAKRPENSQQHNRKKPLAAPVAFAGRVERKMGESTRKLPSSGVGSGDAKKNDQKPGKNNSAFSGAGNFKVAIKPPPDGLFSGKNHQSIKPWKLPSDAIPLDMQIPPIRKRGQSLFPTKKKEVISAWKSLYGIQSKNAGIGAGGGSAPALLPVVTPAPPAPPAPPTGAPPTLAPTGAPPTLAPTGAPKIKAKVNPVPAPTPTPAPIPAPVPTPTPKAAPAAVDLTGVKSEDLSTSFAKSVSELKAKGNADRSGMSQQQSDGLQSEIDQIGKQLEGIDNELKRRARTVDFKAANATMTPAEKKQILGLNTGSTLEKAAKAIVTADLEKELGRSKDAAEAAAAFRNAALNSGNADAIKIFNDRFLDVVMWLDGAGYDKIKTKIQGVAIGVQLTGDELAEAFRETQTDLEAEMMRGSQGQVYSTDEFKQYSSNLDMVFEGGKAKSALWTVRNVTDLDQVKGEIIGYINKLLKGSKYNPPPDYDRATEQFVDDTFAKAIQTAIKEDKLPKKRFIKLIAEAARRKGIKTT